MSLFCTQGYRLAFLALTNDADFEFLTGFFPYAEYALRRFKEVEPNAVSQWRFDGDCWDSEEKFTRHGLEGRYCVMWWDE